MSIDRLIIWGIILNMSIKKADILGKCLSRAEVREYDRRAIEEMHVSGVVLMENAGRGCFDVVKRMIPCEDSKPILIICGKGNNGGDGYVIARHLYLNNYSVQVLVLASKNSIKGDALINLNIIRQLDIPLEFIDRIDSSSLESIKGMIYNSGFVVDAILGTGLNGELRDGFLEIIDAINTSEKLVMAVDIPSGLDCDTGLPLGGAVKATATVSFVAMKKGFCESRSTEYTGDIYIASIGI